MKCVSLLCLVVFTLSACICADSKSTSSRIGRKTFVIGGKVVSDAGAPWHVAIMNKRKLICGGTLLRNNVVLTAGECIKDLEPADILVRAGSITFKNGGQLRKVRETIHHPQYDGKSHAYNVALLHLMRSFNATSENIARVKLPDEKTELPSSITVYGWGMSKSNGNSSITKNLRFSKTKVYSAKKCANFLPDGELDKNVFCTGDRAKQVDVCNDDLGSPAITEGNLQFGVVSEGGACTDSQTTIFTNVLAVKPWITETLREIKSTQKKEKKRVKKVEVNN